MIKLIDFSKRHCKENFGGTKILDITPEQFELDINQKASIIKNLPGYAPFCRLLVCENWTTAKSCTLEITPEIEGKIKSAYQARTENELPVLTRWAEGIDMPTAKYLIVIVYDQAQIRDEDEKQTGMPSTFDGTWGVVAILGQMHPEEEPMTPITMMRNALGKEEGGSGVELDCEKYKASVEFWSKNIMVKS